MSLILSIFLCFDKIYYRITRNRPKQITTHKRYLQVIHTIETLLHTFSDQQLVSAISLLFTLNDQACTISAYDFNLVCTMLLISVVVHLNSLIMISDFIFKGKAIAFSRIASIALQLILTGIVFSARNTSIFPFEPQALAIMPAACFENTNATSSAGLADFVNLASNITTNATLTTINSTGNGTDTLWYNLEAATSTTHGLPEYIALVIFVFLAVVTLLFEWIGTETGWNRHIGWGSIVVSVTSTITSISLTAYAFSRYTALTNGMMVEELYQLAAVTPLTLSQLLPFTLLTSSLFPVINAVVGECLDLRILFPCSGFVLMSNCSQARSLLKAVVSPTPSSEARRISNGESRDTTAWNR